MQQVTLEQRLCHGNHLWHILMITVQFGYLIQMERIIEWITIANTFSPTLVWSSRYVNHWNAKQVYVLGPRQGASAMDVFGLQFATDKLYYTFYQTTRYTADTHIFEIPVHWRADRLRVQIFSAGRQAGRFKIQFSQKIARPVRNFPKDENSILNRPACLPAEEIWTLNLSARHCNR